MVGDTFKFINSLSLDQYWYPLNFDSHVHIGKDQCKVNVMLGRTPVG